jgi:hypothetical protein
VLSETTVMRDIHVIREKMSAELQLLSTAERAEKTNREAIKIAEIYGFKLIEKPRKEKTYD